MFCHAELDGICILHISYFRLNEKRSRCPRAYYSNSCATYRVLIRAGDIELNPGPTSLLEISRDIQVLVMSRQKVCKNLTKLRNIQNLIPIHRSFALISPLTLALINVRSIKSKSAVFNECVLDSKADLITLTEAWLTADDTAAKLEISVGYKLINQPRIRCKGGGIALLHRNNIVVEKMKSKDKPSSFEFMESSVKSG